MNTLTRDMHQLEHLRNMQRRQRHSPPDMGNFSAQNLTGTQYQRDWFSYEFAFGSLTTSQTKNLTVQIQADSDFELMQIEATANPNGLAEPWLTSYFLPATIFITDTGTGRNLMQNPVPLSHLVGDGKLPYILPEERIFVAKSTIQVTLVSISAATWDNYYVTFSGAKLFNYGNAAS